MKCLFEGEEEIGSASLATSWPATLDAWRADAAVMSDMTMLDRGRPAITELLRGALSVELEFRGQRQDLHSGNFGGAIHNPLQALCEVVARLHDARGAIAIPRFYERVRAPTRAQRAYMARVGPSDEQILRDAGAAQDGASRASASTSGSRSVRRSASTAWSAAMPARGEGGDPGARHRQAQLPPCARPGSARDRRAVARLHRRASRRRPSMSASGRCSAPSPS